MRSAKNFIILAFIAAIGLYGCVDEPTIEPVPRPFSMVRVGHFAYNVDDVTLFVDGQNVGSLSKNNLTSGFIEVKSGVRSFRLVNSANQEIYNKQLTINSYQAVNVFFTGYYAPGVDTLNTFGEIIFEEGEVYIPVGPEADESIITVLNLAPPTPTESDTVYRAIVDEDSLEVNLDNIGFNERRSVARTPGSKIVEIVKVLEVRDVGDDIVDSVASYSGSFEGAKFNYVIITGDPNSPTIIFNSRDPLPVRSKYD